MTQYPHPDYDAVLKISADAFDLPSGIAFKTLVGDMGKSVSVAGMLIILGSSSHPDGSGKCDAWIWAEFTEPLPEGRKIKIEIVSCCDSMVSPNRAAGLKQFHGVKLAGRVSRCWNAGTD